MTPHRIAPARYRRWRLAALRRAPATRRMLAVTVMLWLLLQVGVAAFACASPVAPTPSVGNLTHAMAMAGSCARSPDPATPATCAQQCAVFAPLPPTPLPTVPASALPALPPLPTPLIIYFDADARSAVDRLQIAPSPPLNRLFCTLQI